MLQSDEVKWPGPAPAPDKGRWSRAVTVLAEAVRELVNLMHEKAKAKA
jgi:hypothetical protein